MAHAEKDWLIEELTGQPASAPTPFWFRTGIPGACGSKTAAHDRRTPPLEGNRRRCPHTHGSHLLGHESESCEMVTVEMRAYDLRAAGVVTVNAPSGDGLQCSQSTASRPNTRTGRPKNRTDDIPALK